MMPLQRHIKNVVRNYTEAERKVREATSNDPWGPSSTLMSEIADKTYNVIAFTEIMQMIWRRLNDKNKNWRHVYKALILLEYIIKTGSDKVAVQCRENIHAIETLIDFYYVEDGKDVGNSVREKARSLNVLLRDEERLQEERAKALLARERLVHGVVLGTSVSANTYSPPLSMNCDISAFPDDRRPSFQPSLSAATGDISNDIDSAHPQSYTEEQLQLQLALVISKEEHERELQKRHEEDVKEALKLQMVLEQSKRDEQNRSATASLISEANSGSGGGAAASTTGNGGGLFNLIDTSLSAAPANMPDPWSTIVPDAVPPVTAAAYPSNSNHSNSPFAATLPFSTFPCQQSSNEGGNRFGLMDSIWNPKEPNQTSQSQPVPVADNNPWAALDPLETAFTRAHNGTDSANSNDFGAGLLGDVGIVKTSAAATTLSGDASTSMSTSITPSRKRTPADFLGDHKDLVDLEKLVDRNPERGTNFASTNPFSTGSRPLTGQSTNPFCTNQPLKMSLNQLGSTGAANGSSFAVLGSRSLSAFTSFTPHRGCLTAHGSAMLAGQVAPTSISTATFHPPQQPHQSRNPFF